MSKEQNTIELIESYLENTMSPEARESFENLLQQDPIVRSEFEVQQQLVNSIKEFRRAELKAQLNNVTVGVGPTALLSLKTAAIITITAIVGLGTFLYLQKEDASITKIDLEQEQTATTEQVTEPIKPEAPSAEDQIANMDIVETPDTSEEQPVSQKIEPVGKIATPIKKAVSQPDQELAEQTAIVSVPTVLQPNKDEDDLSIEELELPNDQLSQTDNEEQGTLAIENTDNSKYNFHYQFYQDKLFLYGDFKDTPYEILELNFSNGKKLFMYYRGAYYSLRENQVEIASLEALADSETIKKLEIIKANK